MSEDKAITSSRAVCGERWRTRRSSTQHALASPRPRMPRHACCILEKNSRRSREAPWVGWGGGAVEFAAGASEGHAAAALPATIPYGAVSLKERGEEAIRLVRGTLSCRFRSLD